MAFVPDSRTFAPPVESNNLTLPQGTSFSGAADTLSWAYVGTYGEISVSPSHDVAPGTYSTNITVTYPDGSTDQINQSITIVNNYFSSHTSGTYLMIFS